MKDIIVATCLGSGGRINAGHTNKCKTLSNVSLL
jgi:hypothetical protein